MLPLRSPSSGRPLRQDTPHSLADGGGERWPVIDGIPYLRVNREALVVQALERLDAGLESAALGLLLADQDDWFRGERPSPETLRDLVRRRDEITLREAMRLLSFGPVATYFAHRWSDPTFLAGLALVEAHWNEPARAFELACGIGHNLRELERREVAVAGADVVFAKLWLARHWVVGPSAELVCFDAAGSWPIGPEPLFDLVLCHDAFYFLEPKPEILAAMRGLATSGWLAVGHIHNRDAANLSAGRAVTSGEIDTLFPDALVYDDAELTRALAEARAPRPAPAASLKGVEAFSVVAGPSLVRTPRPVVGGLALPRPGATLTRNPIYAPARAGEGHEIAWPSERYALEYGSRVTYPQRTSCPDRALSEARLEPLARRRELVDLPERW